jgi:RimJ/RimL family protein N-acetyltransferase
MTTFGIPTVETARLRLRAFRAADLDAYAAMQANPEIMRPGAVDETKAL